MFWTSAHVFDWPDQERKCPQGTSESGTWWLKDRWGREWENCGEEGEGDVLSIRGEIVSSL